MENGTPGRERRDEAGSTAEAGSTPRAGSMPGMGSTPGEGSTPEKERTLGAENTSRAGRTPEARSTPEAGRTLGAGSTPEMRSCQILGSGCTRGAGCRRGTGWGMGLGIRVGDAWPSQRLEGRVAFTEDGTWGGCRGAVRVVSRTSQSLSPGQRIWRTSRLDLNNNFSFLSFSFFSFFCCSLLKGSESPTVHGVLTFMTRGWNDLS